jgi:hypothetical protein
MLNIYTDHQTQRYLRGRKFGSVVTSDETLVCVFR